jgi:type I restriction enzyme S subunit
MKCWTSRPLNDFCVEIEDRCGERDLVVFSVSKNLGILPQTERFKKRVASADTSRYKVAKPGDFVFDPMLLWSGSISRNTTQTVGVVSPAYCVFRSVKGLNHRFLHLYLTQPERLPFYDSISFGTNERRRKAQFSDFARLEIPVPPQPEQDRIVNLLDEAEELQKFRAQADRRTADLIPALFHEMFGNLLKKTAPWPSISLGEIANFGSGATPSKGNQEFWNGRTPWVSPKDMKMEEICDTEDHVSTKAFEETNLQLIPKDTVLIVVRGMILAHTVPICICRVPVTINQDIKALLLTKHTIEPEFLHGSLQAQHMHLLNQVSTATHGTKKLDSGKLRAIEIPIPPLPLQKEFASRVTEIRGLDAKQAASRESLDALFQSMIHRAFRAEL